MKCPYCEETIDYLKKVKDSVREDENNHWSDLEACICPKCEKIVGVLNLTN